MGTSATSLQDTFLNLLVTELQNQDPTSPVDPTAMVGQMVSLNQLDQLISINQTLDNMSSGTSGSSVTTGKAQTSSASPMVAAIAGNSATTGSTTAAATAAIPNLAGAAALSQQQPVYNPAPAPNALMNLYGSFGTTATTLNSTVTGGR
jgi:flagellar basal-body rod modification protein FlgD